MDDDLIPCLGGNDNIIRQDLSVDGSNPFVTTTDKDVSRQIDDDVTLWRSKTLTKTSEGKGVSEQTVPVKTHTGIFQSFNSINV